MLHGKIFAVILFFMLVRWSWPRFRFDQLMDLAWKVMLPLGLVNLVAVAILYEAPATVIDPSDRASAGRLASSPPRWVVFVVAWLVTAVVNPLVDRQPPAARLVGARQSTRRS